MLARRVRERQDAAVELYELLEESPQWQSVEIEYTADPVALGARLRTVLEINLPEQRAWRHAEGAERCRRGSDSGNRRCPPFPRVSANARSPTEPGGDVRLANDVIVHGIPGDRPLSSGDLVSIDCAVRLDGWNADSAITIAIGSPSLDDARLIAAAHNALDAGVAATVAEVTIGDIAAAVERRARVDGPRALANLTGHGIGQSMWEPPLVPNAGPAGSGRRLEVGLVIAIEPMLTEGSVDSVIDSNGWSIRTADGARCPMELGAPRLSSQHHLHPSRRVGPSATGPSPGVRSVRHPSSRGRGDWHCGGSAP